MKIFLPSLSSLRALLLMLAMCLALSATATPDRMKSFHSVIPHRGTTHIEDTKCMTCHVRPPRFNDFGRAVHDELKRTGQRLVTAQTLAALAKLDSDKDGFTNEQEWTADTLPGDPTDHPAGTEKEEEHEGGGFPDHAFHPALVHFPIALFIFGAIMDILGWKKNSASMRDAAGPCLLWGALSCLVVVPTGLTAFFMQKLAWSGAPLTHFICAVTALVLMITAVLMRRAGKRDEMTYIAVVALAAIAVGVAGHFGSVLVFSS